MNGNWLEIQGLEKNFDGIRALADFSCSVGQGEIVGLIGPNGAGKTTLFNVMTGFIAPDQGGIRFREKDLLKLPPYRMAAAGIARTFQKLRLIRRMSVLENVLLSFRDQPGERLGPLFFRGKAVAEVEEKNREIARSLLKDVRLSDKADDPAEGLSYGQQKLLSIVCCLATQADLLLLDEPIAGIAPAMIEQILLFIRRLPEQGKSVILIEHNLDAIMQVSDRVIFMDGGAKISEGSPTEVRNDPRVIEAYLD